MSRIGQATGVPIWRGWPFAGYRDARQTQRLRIMAIKPGTTPAPTPRFNETAMAIGASLVIGVVLATILTGNPFRAMSLAYTDYSGTPAAGAGKASTTRAPAVATPPANRPSATDTKTNG
jgi:hypothetical protein